MIDAAERLYGPYRWGRYDMLVLPPSFPFGGMENPRLTFATPTILAGDRSLVSLVAHELAHSWSGNLVTNATWNDFWLNEGFTIYFEHRIMEEVYGRDQAEMLALLSRQELEEEIERLGADQSRHPPRAVDLAGRDPDDGDERRRLREGLPLPAPARGGVGPRAVRRVPRALLRSLRVPVDDHRPLPGLAAAGPAGEHAGVTFESLRVDEWIDGPGLPANAPRPRSDAFDARRRARARAGARGAPARELADQGLGHAGVAALPAQLPGRGRDGRASPSSTPRSGFTASGNSEILSAWLLYAIEHDYEPAYPALERSWCVRAAASS